MSTAIFVPDYSDVMDKPLPDPAADVAEYVDFTGAILRNTIFADHELSSAIGLDSVIHRGPTTLGIDTIYRSSGALPESFLRGCGVFEEFITYSHY
jgi:hypothetical protein